METPPSYAQITPNSNFPVATRFTITSHLKVNNFALRRISVVPQLPTSCASFGPNASRDYAPRYSSLASFALASLDNADEPYISYTRRDGSGAFEITFPHAGSSSFTLTKSRPSKLMHINPHAIFKCMVPIVMSFRLGTSAANGVKCKVFSWRTAVREIDTTSSILQKRKVDLNTDLVLLDDQFQECARFVNEVELNKDKAEKQVWGTLEVKNPVDDDRLLQQIILSLLALIEVHVQMAVESGQNRQIVASICPRSTACLIM